MGDGEAHGGCEPPFCFVEGHPSKPYLPREGEAFNYANDSDSIWQERASKMRKNITRRLLTSFMKPLSLQRTRKVDVIAFSTKRSLDGCKVKSHATAAERCREHKTRSLLLVLTSRNRSRERKRPLSRCPTRQFRISTAPFKITPPLKFCRRRSTPAVAAMHPSPRQNGSGSASCRQSFASK